MSIPQIEKRPGGFRYVYTSDLFKEAAIAGQTNRCHIGLGE